MSAPTEPGSDLLGLDVPIGGVARVDRRTKHLVKRLRAGDIAVIDHVDLDSLAARQLVEARPAAVVNAAVASTGRYPNEGPLILLRAGIPLLDAVGSEVMEGVTEGAPVTIIGSEVWVSGVNVASGTRQSLASIAAIHESARERINAELGHFAENTLKYLRQEFHLVLDGATLPDVGLDMSGRQALVVVRGEDYREDLSLLLRSGYLQEVKPVLVAVDGAADAMLDSGLRPDVIVGDFDSISERALRSGAQLVVHAYPDGRAPGAQLLDAMGLDHVVVPVTGTSEDLALLLAHESGAELIVAVGSHTSMVDFLDKGRDGMSSTFLVRLKLGSNLVDAKGVNRLYQTRVRNRDVLYLVLSAIVAIAVIVAVSPQIRTVLRGFWLTLFN